MQDSKLTKTQVEYVAKLANLELGDKEIEKFSSQLSAILDYVSQLNEVDTKNVEPVAQITGLENVMRNDTTAPGLTNEEALSNASQKQDGFFKVKAIFE